MNKYKVFSLSPHTVPSVFIYPACDTKKYTDYKELSHIYEGYVSPNFTTYVKIAPQNFRSSDHLKLLVGRENLVSEAWINTKYVELQYCTVH